MSRILIKVMLVYMYNLFCLLYTWFCFLWGGGSGGGGSDGQSPFFCRFRTTRCPNEFWNRSPSRGPARFTLMLSTVAQLYGNFVTTSSARHADEHPRPGFSRVSRFLASLPIRAGNRLSSFDLASVGPTTQKRFEIGADRSHFETEARPCLDRARRPQEHRCCPLHSMRWVVCISRYVR